jgi:AMME syndrome candidate gene 1 protein
LTLYCNVLFIMAATVAQCAYCFESLSASLQKRKQLSLGEVEQLWDEYTNRESEDAAAGNKQSGAARLPAVSRLIDSDTSSESSSTAQSASSSTPSLNTTASSTTSISSKASSLLSVAQRLGRGSGSQKDDAEFPLFVTYETLTRSGRKDLRGCIGTFEPHKLDAGLRSYALTS